MNKRLRKKKHVGEYNHLGFSVEGKFTPEWSAAVKAEIDAQNAAGEQHKHGDDALDVFCDELIALFEANHLGGGGGFSPTGFGEYVTRCRPGHRRRNGRIWWTDTNATEADRELVRAWLATKPFVIDVKIGQLAGQWTYREEDDSDKNAAVA